MTLIDCADGAVPLRARSVENTPWQIRAKRAGLSQKELARLLGVAENTVSLQLRGRWQSGVPRYIRMFILAWEKLPQDMRDTLRAEGLEMEAEDTAGGRK